MKPFKLTSLADLQSLDADTIIDVRAPAEFAEDHLPGAINLPVLDDAQRAEVGTLYKRVSRFEARKIGGALVAQNTASHLQEALAQKDGGWQPLVYCWRGGQRSGAFATILDQVGWRVRLLEGGYRSYRREVVKALYDTPLPHRIMLIDGGTGTAKTALLHQLSAQGAQVVDLEGMAAHRGSLFGAVATPQPAQKMFDSRVAAQLAAFDPDTITFVEAESSKVGQRAVPPSLWTAMHVAPRILISAPLSARSSFLCRAYVDLTEDADLLAGRIDKLRPYHSRERIEQWHGQARAGEWQALAAGLIVDHYDPRYSKTLAQSDKRTHPLELPDLDESTLARTAAHIRATFT
ncbi:tRNA 2-selenouridine(34) synthase MnmH [Rhizobiaceae bacterium]|nr:tRNA 2-selenouridine(34) synthase MnmH [Rhizobiaceae bacterium]